MKLHWHLLSFSVPEAGRYDPFSLFVSTKHPGITIPQINAARDNGNVPSTAVLQTISSLGKWTQEEFAGQQETKE
jgi:hypothetical protein